MRQRLVMKTAGVLLVCGASVLALQQAPAAVESADAPQTREILGRLPTGAVVSFVQEGGKWGMDISGPPHILQHQPARLEIYQSGSPRDVPAGYTSVRPAPGTVTATADISGGAGVSFHLEDRWS